MKSRPGADLMVLVWKHLATHDEQTHGNWARYRGLSASTPGWGSEAADTAKLRTLISAPKMDPVPVLVARLKDSRAFQSLAAAQVPGDYSPEERRRFFVRMLRADWEDTMSARRTIAITRAVHEVFDTPLTASIRDHPYWNRTDEFEQAGLRDFVKAVYDETQDQLRSAGIANVTLYRGLTFDHLDELPGVYRESLEMGPREVAMRPLSSFTTDLAKTRSFVGRDRGALVSAAFPADRIFSLARTGLGNPFEAEAIVLSGKTRAWVWAWDKPTAPELEFTTRRQKWPQEVGVTKAVIDLDADDVNATWLRAKPVRHGARALKHSGPGPHPGTDFIGRSPMLKIVEMTREGPKLVGTVDGDELAGDIERLRQMRDALEDKSEAGWLKRYHGSYLFAVQTTKKSLRESLRAILSV